VHIVVGCYALSITKSQSRFFEYSSSVNILISPLIRRSYAARMKSYVIFSHSFDQSRIQIFRATPLGVPDTLLKVFQYWAAEEIQIVDICIPGGEYRLAFVVYSESNSAGFGEVTFTEEQCSFSTAIENFGEYYQCVLSTRICLLKIHYSS
jgi:hypothetical protein